MPEDQKVPPLPKPPARPRSNRKLLAFLILFFVTVLVILFFRSSLSRIDEIQIEGIELIPKEVVGQAAALVPGDSFFATSGTTIENRVKSLPMIKSVKVTKHFPGVLHIQVQEFPKVAFQFTAVGKTQAVLADGTSIDLPPGDVPIDRPILSGWTDNDPNKKQLCKVLGEIQAVALSDISEIKPDPSESYPDKIKIYTRSQFEVYTTIGYFPDKIDNLPAYIATLKENNVSKGVIKMLEVDNHAPFQLEQDKSSSDTKATPVPSATPKATPKPTPKSTPKDTSKTN
ncbi:FtsQ-type POTRA domain-containing protein [Paenibacillus sp. GP183]|uniref:cell division protein FtsQ/DivIB n=1 Tax=Paenibacillus sp. GP183 TaxID=1882751 RepID=UPI000895C9D4|nr:FtsQ-type POTRA domain-containing protein [Paenibacillus sp. GP183]SEB41881.1 cell division protein FtsQ [Paenibacillus sp. GP183]